MALPGTDADHIGRPGSARDGLQGPIGVSLEWCISKIVLIVSSGPNIFIAIRIAISAVALKIPHAYGNK